MRSILIAIVSLLAFVTAAVAKPGVDRWPVKTSPPIAGRTATIPIEALIAMRDLSGIGHNDARFQAVRIPGAEGQVVQTTGWLMLVAAEGDGDFHMQMSASPTAPSPCLIIELPSAAYVKDPALKAQVTAVRLWLIAQMFRGKTPSAAGSVIAHPVKVTVTGALFYDDSHVGDAPRGKRGMHAGTLFEIHPVTAISFAP